AGWRAISRARRRDLSRAAPRRAGDSRQRNTVAGKLRARARRPLSLAQASAARDRAVGIANSAPRSEPRIRQPRRTRSVTPPGDRRPGGARCADAAIRQPPRLRAIASLRRVRVEGDVSALHSATRRASRCRSTALPPLRIHRGAAEGVPGVRQPGSLATRLRYATARARALRALSRRTNIESRSRQQQPKRQVG